jgi:hypothetical protein
MRDKVSARDTEHSDVPSAFVAKVSNRPAVGVVTA